MTFTRLGRGDLLAMVAALALLLVMALDWYTTKIGEQARDTAAKIEPQLNNQTVPTESVKENQFAETQEKNAWQATALIDRVIALVLAAAAALAIVAAWARAAERKLRPLAQCAGHRIVGLAGAAARLPDPPAARPQQRRGGQDRRPARACSASDC